MSRRRESRASRLRGAPPFAHGSPPGRRASPPGGWGRCRPRATPGPPPGCRPTPIRNLRRRKTPASRATLGGRIWTEPARKIRRTPSNSHRTVGSLCPRGRGPGHLHAYVRLAAPVEAKQLHELNRRLVAYLHADASLFRSQRISPPAWHHQPQTPGSRLRPGHHGGGFHGHGEGPGWEPPELDRRFPPGAPPPKPRCMNLPIRPSRCPVPCPRVWPSSSTTRPTPTWTCPARLYTLVVASPGRRPERRTGCRRRPGPSAVRRQVRGARLDSETLRCAGQSPGRTTSSGGLPNCQ